MIAQSGLISQPRDLGVWILPCPYYCRLGRKSHRLHLALWAVLHPDTEMDGGYPRGLDWSRYAQRPPAFHAVVVECLIKRAQVRSIKLCSKPCSCRVILRDLLYSQLSRARWLDCSVDAVPSAPFLHRYDSVHCTRTMSARDTYMQVISSRGCWRSDL